MNFPMPSTFPEGTFHEFGKLASAFFPATLSDENLDDPLQKRRHFQGAWLAVRYRYRACSEHNEAFKALLTDAIASDLWREWSEGEEHHYKLEQCLYHFFINALSAFESLGFCLYFVGSMVCPKHFPCVSNPKRINLANTSKAFTAGFPCASITNQLAELSGDTEYSKIGAIRNILAHRLSGRRNVQSSGVIHPDGTYTQTREEIWDIPDIHEKLVFNAELIQRHFDDVTRLLTALILASLEFVKSKQKSVSE